MNRRLVATAICIVFVFFCGSAFAQRGSMDLVTPETGWFSNLRHLWWTADSGVTWKDITPHDASSREIASIFFVNSSIGWVLLAVRDKRTNDTVGFDLASTTTAGTEWTITRVVLPSDDRHDPLAGDARMDFVDASHGWINLGIVGGAAANPGMLLATANGGATWNDVRGFGRGSVRFLNPTDGWFTNQTDLYVTHDNARTWQPVILKAPPQVQPAFAPTYTLPVFLSSQIGFLSVTYSGRAGSPSAMVLFSTADGGRTWAESRVLPNLRETSVGQVFPSTVADSVWIAAATSNRRRLIALSTNSQTAGNETGADMGAPAWKLSFVSGAVGWVMTTRERLLATNDSGATWKDITPGPKILRSSTLSAASSQFQSLSKAMKVPIKASSPVSGSALAFVSRHVGFDQKFVAVARPDMLAWWNSSPYFDVGFYLNGALNRPNDSLLDGTWVSNVQGEGWGLIPTWADYQAPCACLYGRGQYPNCTDGLYTYTINPDPTNNFSAAYAQGVQSADCAAASAGGGTCNGPKPFTSSGIGLGGTIIYDDLEYYNPSASVPVNGGNVSCGAPVNAFLNGWIAEIHSNGYLTGVYGNPDPASTWYSGGNTFPALSTQPDDVWIAKGDSRATVWGLGSVQDTWWTNDQRVHQYTQDGSETWGDVTFSVDTDIEDGATAGGAATKSYTWSYNTVSYPGAVNGSWVNGTANIYSAGQTPSMTGTWIDANYNYYGFLFTDSFYPFNYPTAPQTFGNSVNNQDIVVGEWDEPDTYIQHGFLYDGTNITSIDYPGAAATVATGINDDDKVVGYYATSSSYDQGFIYDADSGTYQTVNYPGSYLTQLFGINGDNEIVGEYCMNASQGAVCGGFIRDANGNYTDIIYDNQWVEPYAINNNEQVVGAYGYQYPFFYQAGSFFQLNIPNYSTTSVYGINDAAQIVGSGDNDGFLGSPPQ